LDWHNGGEIYEEIYGEIFGERRGDVWEIRKRASGFSKGFFSFSPSAGAGEEREKEILREDGFPVKKTSMEENLGREIYVEEAGDHFSDHVLTSRPGL
jgi:hypothetical protein